MRRFYPPTESDLPMHGWRPYSDVHRERIRAHEKHDDNGDSMERKSWDQFDVWLSVIGEEWGEVNKVLCDHRHLGSYGSYADMAHELREELIQTAAMVLAWVDAIDEERCSAESTAGFFKDHEIDHCSRHPGHAPPHTGWSGIRWETD